jgi:8-oxo-dGTP diphosphatase
MRKGSMSQHPSEFACALLTDTQGRFLFQQRDDIPGIRFPGRIGCFGGRRENGESTLECVARELHEEIGYFIAPERFRHLVIYDGIVDTDGTPGAVKSSLLMAFQPIG